MKSSDVLKSILKIANKKKAKILSGFFKTAKGQYGYGDCFLGINVPDQRKIAKEFKDIELGEVTKLLSSKYHEVRLTSLFILISKYLKSGIKERDKIFKIYLKNLSNINNWDLVDLSAPNIIGNHLKNKSRNVLYKLSKSKNLWERRISIISTFSFIKEGDFTDTLKISKNLLTDKEDLIHKAVGWMLREVGKKDKEILKNFLRENINSMPRTTLRYSIERFSEKERKNILIGKI